MNAFEYIFQKQVQWAYNHNIELVGSKGIWGRQAYTQSLEDNLFEPLEPEIRRDFESGDGGELTGDLNNLPKMHAVHSSSALSVNIFQYWLRLKQAPKIAAVELGSGQDNYLIFLE